MTQRTILVIEDEPKNRKLACDLCAAWGHSVLSAQDGAEGLALARSAMPDLVLTDIQMPALNGLEVTRAIKADPATQRIPVVVISAHNMSGDEQSIRASGCDEYMSKPLDTRQLRATIERLLPREESA